MYYNYGIILAVMLYSVLSAIELNLRKEIKYLFWKWSFYLSINLFILSFAKYYLGYYKENLIESFWNAQLITLVHYSVPLIIMAVVLPLLLRLLFRGNVLSIIRYFDSALFLSLSFTFFFARKLNNKTYCIAFGIALLVTLAAIMVKKTAEEYVIDLDLNSIKHRSTEIILVLLYYFVTVVFYTPNELYLNNAADFPMSYWYFFGKLLLSGILVTAILLTGMLVYLNQSHLRVYLTLLSIFLTMGYIQGLFLNGQMGVLDGTLRNEYDNLKTLANLIVWIVFIAGMVIFAWKRYDLFKKTIKIMSVWIILIQIVTFGIMLFGSEGTGQKGDVVLTTEGMLEVGENNNVIVFILDKFDGSYVDEILRDDLNFFEPLKDFVSYENAASAFCPTHDSIPFLLTGTAYDEECLIDYKQYAYGEECLLRDINNAGYSIGVYTNKYYVADSMKDCISNYEEGIQRTCSMSSLFSLMTQCSMYKMAPFAAKYYYIYDTSDIALLVVNDKIVNTDNDLPFYHKLTKDGLYVSEENRNGTFRFIHMHGGHPPYIMTEDFQYIAYDPRRDSDWGSGISQRKGALKIVYEYIRQLKELGKYDDALIIVTTDHGMTGDLCDLNGNVIEVSYPILFVKEPYEVHESLVTSNAPVCHADLIETIRREITGDVSERTLKEIGVGEERIRYMNVSTPDEFVRYEIKGDIRELQNWRFLYRKQKQ